MQRHGCLHVDRYRWQLYGKLHCRWSLVLIRKWKKTRNYCQPEPILPITFALRELSFAPSPRLGSLTWFPQCLPEQLHPNTHGCASVQLRPQIPSMSTPYGAVCYENFQPYAGQQSLLSVWYMCHCGYIGTEFYSEAHFLSVDKKKSCLFVGPCSWCCLQKAAHLCRRWSHAALTHCSTTSYFWQQPAWADSEHLEKNRVLAERVRFDAQMIWDQAVLRAVILSYVSDTCMWPVFHGKKVSNRRRKFPNQFGFPWKKSPRGHLTPKYYTNTLHIQTLEVRYADHTQCLQAQTPTTELDSLGSLYVGWNVF